MIEDEDEEVFVDTKKIITPSNVKALLSSDDEDEKTPKVSPLVSLEQTFENLKINIKEETDKPRKIQVSNLPKVTEKEVKEAFKECGDIHGVKIYQTGTEGSNFNATIKVSSKQIEKFLSMNKKLIFGVEISVVSLEKDSGKNESSKESLKEKKYPSGMTIKVSKVVSNDLVSTGR